MPDADPGAGDAEYVFKVDLQLSPSDPDVRVEPASVETTLFKRADPPGEEGWLFFRDNLWRGEVNAPDHLRRLAEETLGVEVRSIEFREFRTDDEYYQALRAEIADNLELFEADDTPEAITKYLGSRVHVREP
jgi:hypothetical protein